MGRVKNFIKNGFGWACEMGGGGKFRVGSIKVGRFTYICNLLDLINNMDR